ncbi:MAG TPA: ferritin-like domain-containing protein [Pyrinomonadaceae bacterium]|nr:ferritin-like domain-containing protein [Pyrinomonadaceae bacterium]
MNTMQATGQSKSEMGSGNLTGLQTAPEQAAEDMIRGAMAAEPSMDGGSELADSERAEYINDGYPIGSLPALPVADEADAGDEAVSMALFLDKLSERLAFERMGTRLYDGLINKCETLDAGASNPSVAELQEIREEEHRHFLMLNEVITQLGGDPTVQSPCADVAAVSSIGLMQVIMDPRTSVSQSLQAILTAELTDNAGWMMLSNLADELGYSDISEQFTEALENEERHLENVQAWLMDRVMAKAA